MNVEYLSDIDTASEIAYATLAEVMDNINVYVKGNDKIAELMNKNADQIKKIVLGKEIVNGQMAGFSKDWNINGEDVILGVEKL